MKGPAGPFFMAELPRRKLLVKAGNQVETQETGQKKSRFRREGISKLDQLPEHRLDAAPGTLNSGRAMLNVGVEKLGA